MKLTVGDLIKKLEAFPKDLEVHINDEGNGNYYEEVLGVFIGRLPDAKFDNIGTDRVIIAIDQYE